MSDNRKEGNNPEYREEKEYKQFLKELSKAVGKELTDVEDFKLDIQRYKTDYAYRSAVNDLAKFLETAGKGLPAVLGELWSKLSRIDSLKGDDFEVERVDHWFKDPELIAIHKNLLTNSEAKVLKEFAQLVKQVQETPMSVLLEKILQLEEEVKKKIEYSKKIDKEAIRKKVKEIQKLIKLWQTPEGAKMLMKKELEKWEAEIERLKKEKEIKQKEKEELEKDTDRWERPDRERLERLEAEKKKLEKEIEKLKASLGANGQLVYVIFKELELLREGIEELVKLNKQQLAMQDVIRELMALNNGIINESDLPLKGVEWEKLPALIRKVRDPELKQKEAELKEVESKLKNAEGKKKKAENFLKNPNSNESDYEISGTLLYLRGLLERYESLLVMLEKLPEIEEKDIKGEVNKALLEVYNKWYKNHSEKAKREIKALVKEINNLKGEVDEKIKSLVEKLKDPKLVEDLIYQLAVWSEIASWRNPPEIDRRFELRALTNDEASHVYGIMKKAGVFNGLTGEQREAITYYFYDFLLASMGLNRLADRLFRLTELTGWLPANEKELKDLLDTTKKEPLYTREFLHYEREKMKKEAIEKHQEMQKKKNEQGGS